MNINRVRRRFWLHRVIRTLTIPYWRHRYRKYYRYMKVAETIAVFSKGKHTKVAALIIDTHKSIIADGFNGAPRGSRADELTDCRSRKPEKYYWTEHAETNAINNAARTGSSTKDAVMVVTYKPCMSCARSIVQAGIRVVIYKEPTAKYAEDWSDDLTRVDILFLETGIKSICLPTLT